MSLSLIFPSFDLSPLQKWINQMLILLLTLRLLSFKALIMILPLIGSIFVIGSDLISIPDSEVNLADGFHKLFIALGKVPWISFLWFLNLRIFF